MGMTTNPEVETLKVMIWGLIALVGFAIVIIRYFAVKRDKEIDTSLKEASTQLTVSTKLLSDAVKQLEILVNNLSVNYSIRQPIVDERLKKHSEEIIALNAELTQLREEFIVVKTVHEQNIHCMYPVSEEHVKTKSRQKKE